jgi:glycosyltransferase involved in cell wall biosynthesis
MRARVPDVAAFISVSHYFAAQMPRRIGLPLKAVRVVHPGIDAAAYPVTTPPSPPVWGVLLSPGDLTGLTRVLGAFLDARARPDCGALRLRIAGATPSDPSDQSAYDALRTELSARGLRGEAEFLPTFAKHSERLAFLQSLTVLTVLHAEEPAFDLSLLEAMASGVAVVQPSAGANPEILAMAEGGVLFDPASPDALVDALAEIVGNPNKHAVLAHQGRYGVEHGFSLGRMAREIVEAYQTVLAAQSPMAAEHRRQRPRETPPAHMVERPRTPHGDNDRRY